MSNLTPRINKLEKNLVIDGAMEIWPEGVTRSIANNTRLYTSVLMSASNNASGVTILANRQASVPSNTNLSFSNELSKSAAGTMAAGTAVLYDYFVEGYDTMDIYNNEFSLIFWVKSSVASLRSTSIRSTTGSHSFVQQYQINQANTWEMKVLKFPALSTCPGTIDRTTGIGTSTRINVVAGTTYQTPTLNQWISGDFLCGVGEDTTWITGTNHNFSIAGVMLIPGDFTSLTSLNYNFVKAGKNSQDETAMSQRYFEKSYDLNVNPGTATGAGSCINTKAVGMNGGSSIYFLTSKRTAPTVTLYSPTTGTAGQIRDISAGVDRVGTAGSINQNRIGDVGSAATPNGNAQAVHWTADARF